MKLHIILEVTKTEGARQDRDAVFEAVSDELDGLDVWVCDSEHEEDSGYEVSVLGYGPTAKDASATVRTLPVSKSSDGTVWVGP